MEKNKFDFDLPKFEKEQRDALVFLQVLYGEDKPLERPTKCVVEGCNNPFIYNSGMCIDHAF